LISLLLTLRSTVKKNSRRPVVSSVQQRTRCAISASIVSSGTMTLPSSKALISSLLRGCGLPASALRKPRVCHWEGGTRGVRWIETQASYETREGYAPTSQCPTIGA
jgi:hypothetical protein